MCNQKCVETWTFPGVVFCLLYTIKIMGLSPNVLLKRKQINVLCCMFKRTETRPRACMRVCVCVCVCVCFRYVYVCVCVYKGVCAYMFSIDGKSIGNIVKVIENTSGMLEIDARLCVYAGESACECVCP